MSNGHPRISNNIQNTKVCSTYYIITILTKTHKIPFTTLVDKISNMKLEKHDEINVE